MEKLVLIDGNSLINRAFYAMPILSTKNGTFTNAVYGFLNMFFKMLETDKPSHVGVAFDLKAPTFRHKLYKEYKGTRKPMPDELRPQIPLLREVLTQMGVACFSKEGVEADDIIGTIAKKTHIPTFIYTGDRDSFQLVDGETSVCFTKRGITDIDLLTEKNFKEKTGINPTQVIDLKSLMGDASDNIPGVKGVGEKTALTLVQTYGSIENLYNYVDELSGKLKEKIIDGKESAFLSRTLATIDTDCGIDFNLDDMLFSLPLSINVKQKFIELEFRALLKNEGLFELNVPTDLITDTKVIKTEIKSADELTSAVKTLNGKKTAFVFSDEFISLSDGEREFFVKTALSLLDEGLTQSETVNALKQFLIGNDVITFKKKDVNHFLCQNFNFTLTKKSDDVALIKYLVDFSSDATFTEVIAEYGYDATTPASSLYNVYQKLTEKLKSENMESLYYDLELPLSDVLFEMENSGFKVDIDALKETGKKYAEKLNDLENQIRTLCDEPTLNVNSPKQLGDVIFEKLKLGKGKKTKTGYSTSADVLESLEDTHPVISLIEKYRKIQKLRSTYIEGFYPVIDNKTGLIHTSFNQTVTQTGRLSSKEPNLQNIPVRDDEGKELRKFFVPKDTDRVLISADYSQIELRLLAAFSNCKPLISAFNNGVDIHTATASKVFGVKKEDVTQNMRRNAKAVNFGIIYGISEYGLAKNIKTTPKEAKQYITSYFNTYPEVKEYMDKNVSDAKKTGYAVTMLNRKRYIPELNSGSFMTRQFGERAAMNMPLQGSSADIIKLAMIGVNKRLKKENLKSELILQVHDELIIDAYKEEQEKVIKILKEEMENAVKLSVPLTVEVGVGDTWFTAK